MNANELLNKFFSKIHWIINFISVWFSFKKVYGPSPSRINSDCFFVCALMKNDSIFIDSFVEHYKKMGASRVFLIDNGSDDDSLIKSRKYDIVTVYKSTASFLEHQCLIRRLFMQRFLRGNWIIFVDIDEHLRFPYDDNVNFSNVLSYCKLKKYNAIAACMFDVYSLDDFGKFSSSDDIRDYRYCNLKGINKNLYPVDQYISRGNKISGCDAALFEGGIRKILNPNGHFWLVKHPVMYLSGDLIPFTHPHFCAGANIADFQCALLHYKFFGDFASRLAKSAKSGSRSVDWISENASISPERMLSIDFSSIESVDISDFSSLYINGFFTESEALRNFLNVKTERS